MTDISLLPKSEFDTLGALELYLWVVEADVTKRCMAHCFVAMQEKINRVGGKSHVEEFLADMVKLLQAAVKASKAKGSKKQKVTRSDMVSDIDIQKFYSGAHDAWFMTNKICGVVEELSKRFSSEKEKEPEKWLDEDQVRRICWDYYLKEKKESVTKEEWLSPDCTYSLFLLYNKLLLRDDSTDLEVGQVNAFLMKMVSISMYTWSPRLEYKAEGSDTINFPEFLTVVVKCFTNLNLTMDFTCELISELHKLMVKGILKQGYLKKRGHFRKNWNWRLFVLHLTGLRYYEDENHNTTSKRIILNRDTRLLDVRDAESPNHPNKFVVTCGTTGVDYQICAEDKRTKQSWIQAIQKALALSKIKYPSDREEFVSSLAQWAKYVYGDNPDAEEQTRPPSGIATLQLQKQVTDEVMGSLVKSGSSVSSVSSGPKSPTTPLSIPESEQEIQEVDGYISVEREQTENDYQELSEFRDTAEDQERVYSKVEEHQYDDTDMCVVVAERQKRHSYINLEDINAIGGYSDTTEKKGVIVNGNSTPPHSGDVESDDDDDEYEEIIDLRKPSPATKTADELSTDVMYDVLAPLNTTPQMKSSQSAILNPEADKVYKPPSTSNVTAGVEVSEAAILLSGPQDTYDVPTSSKPASQMMKSRSAVTLTESVYKVPTSSHVKTKSEVAEETPILLPGTDDNHRVLTSTLSTPQMKTSGSATLNPGTGNIYSVPKSPNVSAKSTINEAAVLTPGADDIYKVPKSPNVSAKSTINEAAVLTPGTDDIYNVPKSPNVSAKSAMNEAAVLTPGRDDIYNVPRSTDVLTVLSTNEKVNKTRETSKSLPKRTKKAAVPLPTGGRSQAAVQKTVSEKSRTLSEGTSLTKSPATRNVHDSVH